MEPTPPLICPSDGRHPLYRRMQAADPALFQEILIGP
jgi:hypothetical protein